MSDKTTHNKKNHHESADKMTQKENSADNLTTDPKAEGQNPDNSTDEAQMPVEVNDEKINKLETDLGEMKDKYLRLTADFDNFRRRTAKERIELTQTAGKDVIQSMLTVLDDVDRASKQLETTNDVAVIREGISLVFNKLRTVLSQKGLKVMDAAGKEFDPDLHDAITEIPAPNDEMKGKIIDVVEPGYYLSDKLIRHAKVVVGK